MAGTIRARYRNGIIEPLEKIELPENTELTITINEAKPEEAADAPLPFPAAKMVPRSRPFSSPR